MIYPNKHIQFEESILYKMTYLIKFLNSSKIKTYTILWLYDNVRNNFDNIDEYIYSLDVLYVLNFIDFNFDNNLIIYANRD